MSDISFTSEISAFSVPAGEGKAVVAIAGPGGEIFRNTYDSTLAFEATGYNRVIEADLRSRGTSVGSYTVRVTRGGVVVKTFTRLFIHCDFPMLQPAEEWLRSHFLSDQEIVHVPARSSENVYLTLFTDGSTPCRIHQAWRENGVVKSAVMYYPLAEGLDTVTVDLDNFTHRPYVVSLECGGRRMSVVCHDSGEYPPCSGERTFVYRNKFNTLSYVTLVGVLQYAPGSEVTTAEIGGRMSVIRNVPSITYTFAASQLTYPEAIQVARLCYAREVWLVDESGLVPIVLSGDPSGTISDDRSKRSDIKFSFTADTHTVQSLLK